MTLLELLVVLAIIAIVGGLAFINGNQVARRQAARGAVATFQQSVWQGATAAASRGSLVELHRTGYGLELVDLRADRVLRRYELPAAVSIAADNPILTFTPPGKVDPASLPDGRDGLTLDTGHEVYSVRVSLIGEVVASVMEVAQ